MATRPIANTAANEVDPSVQEPRGVSGFNGPIDVDWTNPAGAEDGKVKQIPRVPAPPPDGGW